MYHRLRSILIGCLALGGAASVGPAAEPAGPAGVIALTVRAGGHDRRDALIQFAIPADRLGPAVVAALASGPVGVAVTDPAGSKPSVAQLSRDAAGSIRATWFLPVALAAGTDHRFHLAAAEPVPVVRSPWVVDGPVAGQGKLTIRHGQRPVFVYNTAPVAAPHPDPAGTLTRDAYIHPAFSPSGALVTGDFSPHHPHHRGIFLAYTHTKWGDAAPDFWNFHQGTGKIVADGVTPPAVGPVSVRFAARHRWELRPPRAADRPETDLVLRERWDLEAFDVPGTPYWLIDLESTQQAVSRPLELLPYRYGGMAYRSAEPSVVGPIDVLTAEGRHRFDGDQKPTRWVDLTGPVAAGSPNYAGVMIADHPANLTYPTVARIHPITLPFFSYVPAHDQAVVLPTEHPTRFRYRIVIHDGHPDPALNDRIAADFAEPPAVALD